MVNAAPAEGHHLSLGVIDDEMLSKYLNTEPGSEVLIVSCGPPAFMADVKSVLEETGHAASTLVRLVRNPEHSAPQGLRVKRLGSKAGRLLGRCQVRLSRRPASQHSCW